MGNVTKAAIHLETHVVFHTLLDEKSVTETILGQIKI